MPRCSVRLKTSLEVRRSTHTTLGFKMNPINCFAIISAIAIIDSHAFHQWFHPTNLPHDQTFLSRTGSPSEPEPTTLPLFPEIPDSESTPTESFHEENRIRTEPPYFFYGQGQPQTYQSSSTTLGETPGFQFGAYALPYADTTSKLRINEGPSGFPSSLPSFYDSQITRNFQQENYNQVDNRAHSRDLQHDNFNQDGASVQDFHQFVPNLILSSQPFNGIPPNPYFSRHWKPMISMDSRIANHGLEQNFRDHFTTYDQLGSSSGASDYQILNSHHGVVGYVNHAKSFPREETILPNRNLFFSNNQNRAHAQSLKHAEGSSSHRHLEHSDLPAERSGLSPLTFDVSQFHFHNGDDQRLYYADCVIATLIKLQKYPKIVVEEGETWKFSHDFRYQKKFIVQKKLNREMIFENIRKRLFSESWKLCVQEKDIWFDFFSRKYHLDIKSYLPKNQDNKTKRVELVFPIYLFYVEMINEIIPRKDTNIGGIESACESYQQAVKQTMMESIEVEDEADQTTQISPVEMKKAAVSSDQKSKISQIKMNTASGTQLQGLLWSLIEIWMKDNRNTLFEIARLKTNITKTNITSICDFVKAFFTTIFSLFVPELTKTVKCDLDLLLKT